MKKLMALLLTLCLAAAVCSAFADTRVEIADTGMTLALPDDFGEDELTDDDIAEGVVAVYISDDEKLEMYVTCYEDVLSVEELKEYLEEEEAYTYLDYTTINGIVSVCELCPEENGEGAFVLYWFSGENGVTSVAFWYEDDAAAERTKAIMETLQ